MAAALRNVLHPLSYFSKELQTLAAAAIAAQRQAYCPYSNFAVGASLLHFTSEITVGCNYENCTLQSCCAERCAIVKANVEGKRMAKAVAVYGAPAALWDTPTRDTTDNGVELQLPEEQREIVCPPCGLCRQLLVEVADLSGNYAAFDVLLVSRDQKHAKLMALADLMPDKFGPADMGMDLSKLVEKA